MSTSLFSSLDAKPSDGVLTASPSIPSETVLFHRSTLLLGSERMAAISAAKGILFGIGGVGSWCAESLVRTGVRHLTLVDSDRVCATNINRQLQASCSTVGLVKTEALRARLLDINPHAVIVPVQRVYDKDSASEFCLDDYDFIVDAIDSLSAKAHLLSNATHSRAHVFSSLGAAAKLDPTRVRVAEFWDVKGCPLGAMLRKLMRRRNLTTAKPVPTVFSDEVMANAGGSLPCGMEPDLYSDAAAGSGDSDPRLLEAYHRKAVLNGSVAHITGIFGLTLAGLVIQRLSAPDDAAS